eukprot:scaffold58_cov256-Pinguiococcus_pyrenoidosus.AAC.28
MRRGAWLDGTQRWTSGWERRPMVSGDDGAPGFFAGKASLPLPSTAQQSSAVGWHASSSAPCTRATSATALWLTLPTSGKGRLFQTVRQRHADDVRRCVRRKAMRAASEMLKRERCAKRDAGTAESGVALHLGIEIGILVE